MTPKIFKINKLVFSYDNNKNKIEKLRNFFCYKKLNLTRLHTKPL